MGQLPDEMGKLAKLQVLRLGFNKLALLLPRAWSGMSSLRFLDLRSNSLTGTLPLVCIELASSRAECPQCHVLAQTICEPAVAL